MFKLPITLTALLLPMAAQAFDNIEIKRSEVPLTALTTAKHFAPGVVFTRYAYEDEDGLRIYEFEAYDVQGRHIEVDVLADGTLQEIELEKSWNEVPISIQIELNLTHPGFKPNFIEASVRPDGTTVYEFEGKDLDNTFVDYEILDNGRSVKFLAES